MQAVIFQLGFASHRYKTFKTKCVKPSQLLSEIFQLRIEHCKDVWRHTLDNDGHLVYKLEINDDDDMYVMSNARAVERTES